MADLDPLFSVRNNFYLGAYQTAISDASKLTGLTEEQKLERDVFVFRSYIELGSYEMVLSEIPTGGPPALAGVRLFARVMKGDSQALAELDSGLEDPDCACNSTYVYLAALARFASGDTTGSLRLTGGAAALEPLALSVQALLSLHRADAAERQLAAMAALDDDATLSQLAAAWVGLAQGGVRAREAGAIFQELGDRFGWTPRLHAGLAAAQMRAGRWEEAEAELQQAVEKNPKDPDVLANLVVVCLHLGKPTARYLGVLKDVAPAHALLQRRAADEDAFERATAGPAA